MLIWVPIKVSRTIKDNLHESQLLIRSYFIQLSQEFEMCDFEMICTLEQQSNTHLIQLGEHKKQIVTNPVLILSNFLFVFSWCLLEINCTGYFTPFAAQLIMSSSKDILDLTELEKSYWQIRRKFKDGCGCLLILTVASLNTLLRQVDHFSIIKEFRSIF